MVHDTIYAYGHNCWCFVSQLGVKTFDVFYVRFEAGTPAIGEAVGLGAAIDYLSQIGMQKIHEYEVTILLYFSKIFM